MFLSCCSRYSHSNSPSRVIPQPSAQIAYINHVLESASETRYHDAAGLFNRFLKTSPFVELWKFYLAYVRYVYDISCLARRIHSQLQYRKMNTGPDTRDTVRKAYEFALNHIGHDRDSSELWVDYIQFLKAGEVSLRIFNMKFILDK